MNYKTFQSELAQSLPDEYAAAEWHGVLCGLICAGRPTSIDTWYGLAADTKGISTPPSEPLLTALTQVYSSTQEQLNSASMAFALMLPDDDAALSMRTAALGVWCDGFLYGLSAGGINRESALPEHSAELLADMAEITQVSFTQDSATAEDEYDYNELAEYIRVGIMLINDELNPIKPNNNSLH